MGCGSSKQVDGAVAPVRWEALDCTDEARSVLKSAGLNAQAASQVVTKLGMRDTPDLARITNDLIQTLQITPIDQYKLRDLVEVVRASSEVGGRPDPGLFDRRAGAQSAPNLTRGTMEGAGAHHGPVGEGRVSAQPSVCSSANVNAMVGVRHSWGSAVSSPCPGTDADPGVHNIQGQYAGLGQTLCLGSAVVSYNNASSGQPIACSYNNNSNNNASMLRMSMRATARGGMKGARVGGTSYGGMPVRPVFISFRVREARPHAMALKRALEVRGFLTFCSEVDLPPGKDWAKSVFAALQCAKVCVVLQTPTYGNDGTACCGTWEELAYASDMRMPIYVIKMSRKVEVAVVWALLHTLQGSMWDAPMPEDDPDGMSLSVPERALSDIIHVVKVEEAKAQDDLASAHPATPTPQPPPMAAASPAAHSQNRALFSLPTSKFTFPSSPAADPPRSASPDLTARRPRSPTTGRQPPPVAAHPSPVKVNPAAAAAADGFRVGADLMYEVQGGSHTMCTMNCVAFSPDGASLAVATDDEEVRILHTASGAVVRRVCHGIPARCNWVAWSPDGSSLAMAGGADRQGGAVVVGAVDDAPRCMLRGHRVEVTHVAWAPFGSQLATTSRDALCRVYDLARGDSPKQLTTSHTAAINACAWAPEGTRVATASADGSVRVHDTRADRQIACFEANTGRAGLPVNCVRWSHDGAWLVSGAGTLAERLGKGGEGLLRVWDLRAQAWLPIPCGEHPAGVSSVCFAPGGGLLATGCADRVVRVWCTERWDLVWSGSLGSGRADTRVTCVDWSPQGDKLASSAWFNVVGVWSPGA